jgi:hypothetical protein
VNGNKPVAMVFAREISDPLTSLVKKIDAATAKSDNKMGSFVVFLNDDEGFEKKLKDLAKQQKLDHTVLTLMEKSEGPYKDQPVAKDADVTVVLYVNKTVKINYAFKKGELKDNEVNKIASDFAKMMQ